MTKKQIRLLKALNFSDEMVKADRRKLLGEGAFGASMGAFNGYVWNDLLKNRAYKKHVKHAEQHGLTPLSRDEYFKKHPGISNQKAALIGAGIGGGLGLLTQHYLNKNKLVKETRYDQKPTVVN